MSAIPDLGSLLDTPLARAVGWALLQFIWQGALVGLAAAVALAALRKAGADLRYVVATISMALMLTLPVASVFQELARNASRPLQTTTIEKSGLRVYPDPASATASSARSRNAERESEAATVSSRGRETTLSSILSGRLTAWLLSGWLVGVLILTVRLLSGWLWVQRLRMHGTPVSASSRETAERLARRLHVTRAVRLIQSAAVEVPTVVGWLKPVILLPVSALAGLSPAQLEAVLAHELAHVRRHDYLVNLLQTIVETLLFYHPAVWWISRQIRIERENCCDDLAVSLCGDRVLYAQTLADLEQLRAGADRLALAANGGSLVNRVRRLLAAPPHAATTPGWFAIAAAVALIVTIAGIAGRAKDRETPQVLEDKAASAPTRPTAAASAPLREKDLIEWREFARALEQGHRALYSAFRDLFPQFRPMPPTPPVAPPQPPPAVPPIAIDLPEPPEPAEPPDVLLAPEAPAFAEPPAFADFPEPPAMVAPSAPPVGPVPPMPPMPRTQRSGTYVWSNDDEKLEVNYRGDMEFTDDDADVKSLSPDGWLRIKQKDRNGSHAIEFRSIASGAIERRFWVGSTERPFEPEGRKWLAEFLPRFIRQSGLGADARTRRIYRTKGARGVLDEISLIQGSWENASVDAAERLGQYEQDRVVSALVGNERR